MQNEMRDRLVELIYEARKEWDVYFNDCLLKGKPRTKTLNEFIADTLIENGVIVPPCKVGDTVYVITSDSIIGFEESRVKRMLLKNLQDGMTIKIIVPCVCDDWGGAVREFYPDNFGKTVFLTKEEAERTLKGGADNE